VAVLLLLLASIGGVVVDGLVLENSAAGTVTVLDHSFTGYRQGQLLAMAAGVGLVLGLLVVGSLSLRRTRRARRRQLRAAKRDLPAHQVAELEQENPGLWEELARRDQALRPPGQGLCQPISAAPCLALHLSDRSGACRRRPTATSSRSTRRPGGSPASAATWTWDCCALMTGLGVAGSMSTPAGHSLRGLRLGA
jgi:hypothetical protein